MGEAAWLVEEAEHARSVSFSGRHSLQRYISAGYPF